MSKQVMIDLMMRLSQSRKERQQFKEDPDRVMAGLDLSEEEREMLKRAKSEELRAFLGEGKHMHWWGTQNQTNVYEDDEDEEGGGGEH